MSAPVHFPAHDPVSLLAEEVDLGWLEGEADFAEDRIDPSVPIVGIERDEGNLEILKEFVDGSVDLLLEVSAGVPGAVE